MIIAFTGTRKGTKVPQIDFIEDFLKRLKGICLHGGCHGADRDFHEIAKRNGFEIIIHPGDMEQYRYYKDWPNLCQPAPYLTRNHTMVDQAELVIAAPSSDKEELRSGTWATIRYAIKKKKPCLIVYPDGTTLQR